MLFIFSHNILGNDSIAWRVNITQCSLVENGWKMDSGLWNQTCISCFTLYKLGNF